MKIGLLTGGGDAPGLNPAIAGFVRRLHREHIKVFGITCGYKGLIGKKIEGCFLTLKNVDPIVSTAGTILGTSRKDLLKDDKNLKSKEKIRRAINNLHGLDGSVLWGG